MYLLWNTCLTLNNKGGGVRSDPYKNLQSVKMYLSYDHEINDIFSSLCLKRLRKNFRSASLIGLERKKDDIPLEIVQIWPYIQTTISILKQHFYAFFGWNFIPRNFYFFAFFWNHILDQDFSNYCSGAFSAQFSTRGSSWKIFGREVPENDAVLE